MELDFTMFLLVGLGARVVRFQTSITTKDTKLHEGNRFHNVGALAENGICVGEGEQQLIGCIHFTSIFNAATFRRSSPGSSMGVSAMKAACAIRGSFNKRRNGSVPIVPFPMC